MLHVFTDRIWNCVRSRVPSNILIRGRSVLTSDPNRIHSSAAERKETSLTRGTRPVCSRGVR